MYKGFVAQDKWLSRAAEWAPNDSFAARFRAIFMASVGRCRASVELLRRAVELDPLSFGAANSLGSALRECGDLKEAEAVFADAVQRWPEISAGTVGLAFTLIFNGKFDHARRLMEARDLGPHHRGLQWLLAVAEDSSPSSRVRAIEAVRRQFARNGHVGLDMLMVAGHFGYVDEALEIGLQANFGPASDAPDPRGTDAYNPPVMFAAAMPEIRRDPRFVAICARLGLVEYWRTTDLWPDCVGEVAPYYDFKAECQRAADGALASAV
jgi:tetratricopeptide (TPR) repeat protein